MLSRRTFLGVIGAALAAQSLSVAADPPRRRRMAIVTTEWRYGSHAWHMGERFLVGYPRDGKWHRPEFVAGTRGKIWVEALPGYAPDLNPWDEGGWHHLRGTNRMKAIHEAQAQASPKTGSR